MTATSVASSSQMFSPFGQATRSQSPAINPFASQSEVESNSLGLGGADDSNGTKRNKRKTRLNDADTDGKRKMRNPFSENDTGLSDSASKEGKKSKKSKDRNRESADLKKPQLNGSDPLRKQLPRNMRNDNNSNPFGISKKTASRPGSSSDLEQPPFQPSTIPNSNDPHARKVYEQLRKDGISPPQWPSEPGNPKNKAEVTKFREKYESYRDRVRASLTKAGLIDDPEKRKALQDAIDFKGICEDMCPEFEKITRINEMDVNYPEKDRKTTFPNPQRMVKKLARSAAGQEAPLPMDVRSAAALRRSLDYLIDDLLQNDDKLPSLHGFLWDRTRAIRRDFTFFSSLTPEEMKSQVYVLENIVRFHATALHLLSQEGKAPEDFVEQQELEQLGKALLSLRDLYDDCNDQGVTCENEPEFRAYYLIFHAFDPNILETLQRQWKPNLWRDSDEVRTAVSLVEALQSTQDFHGPLKDAPSLAVSSAYNSFFRIVEDSQVSYTMACFAECHFPHLRRSILATVKKGLQRPKGTTKDITAAVLNKFLRFDTVEEAIEFAELHDFEFGEDEEDPEDLDRQYLILDNRRPLPHHRLQHQFSQTLVEKKRGSKSLPELIHKTVREDPMATKPQSRSAQESMFMPKPTPSQAPVAASQPFNNAASSPFSSFGQPSNSQPSQNPFATSGTTTNGSKPTFGSAFGSASNSTVTQPAPVSNPFGAASVPLDTKPGVNSFASLTNPAVSPFQDALKSGGTTLAAEQPSISSKPPANPFAAFQKPPSTPTPTPAFNAPAPKSSLDTTTPSSTIETKPSMIAPPAFSFARQGTSPASTGSPSTKGSDGQGTVLGSFTAPGPATTKTPDINVVPPTPQFAPSPFSTATATKSPFSAIFPPSSTQASSDTNKPSDNKAPGAISFTPPAPSTATPSVLSQPLKSGIEPSKPASPLPSFATGQASAAGVTTGPPSSASSLFSKGPEIATSTPVSAPTPPRDAMADFTKWFVKGDNGLLEDFQAFMIDNILQKVFTKFQKEQERSKREEEEREGIVEAEKFRIYNISLKYFHRWKDIARERRHVALRRNGRDQVRKYWEAQRAAELQAQQEAARRAAREEAEIAVLNRPGELKDLLRKKKVNKRKAREQLLASGVLSGVENEEEAIGDIIGRGSTPSVTGSVTSNLSKMSRSSAGGSKTQALRDRFSREPSAGFRRSLPSMSSREDLGLNTSTRSNRVSERWRLKAMGIVQMPDGTALPESLANEVRLGAKRYLGQGDMPPPDHIPIRRRASVTNATRPDAQRTVSGPLPSIETADDGFNNKRKRDMEDEGNLTGEGSDKAKSQKKVMSDAEKLISELRAMREEMEEGASWFKSQNTRLQGEVSRSSTPWDESM